ncbi:hypothetical protein PoB_005497700 [Plakobranchus ocellatus]|uniref:Uncharacterized protein n=1 Tax=Plakobranchus ocellatus TaxID=259542 RepID=A0AAV4CB36_9GAST|nr:hypothetical protein PoB_005497700 [Plakobranchus ocellatus]
MGNILTFSQPYIVDEYYSDDEDDFESSTESMKDSSSGPDNLRTFPVLSLYLLPENPNFLEILSHFDISSARHHLAKQFHSASACTGAESVTDDGSRGSPSTELSGRRMHSGLRVRPEICRDPSVAGSSPATGALA